ncbi:hypothetical protein A3F66_02790 [candidate division TM6 bacterium RIFCSPHIGHO2_12_FULL_32_22]|nr:MAG: hypothetical protein A3F66_02790 [candidate division TM6 bacterium RIFCSPHIGHO2_12_FULL_32_22]
MNKPLLLSIIFLQITQFNTFAGDYYRRQAEAEVAREEAIRREAQIQARKEELIKKDAETIVALLVATGRGIRGCARVVWRPSKIGEGWQNDDGEIIFGTIVDGVILASVVAASISLIVNSNGNAAQR